MEELHRQSNRGKRLLQLAVKLIITVACLWYISVKIDFEQSINAVRNANFGFLFLAFIAFILSKFVSAIRLNIYFHNIDIQLSQASNTRLYWLGMFYNLFLPGAISGDAYKVILLTKRFNGSYKKTSAAVLLDRFSGLVALGIILSAYSFLIPAIKQSAWLLLVGAVLAVGLLYVVTRFLFPYFLPGFLPTFVLGLVVQLLQVVAIYCIQYSLGIPISEHGWIFIFLAAAVITVLPISLGGGLGTREFVFREGALLLALDPDLGIVISLVFYLMTVIGSLPGLLYVFRNPLNNR